MTAELFTGTDPATDMWRERFEADALAEIERMTGGAA